MACALAQRHQVHVLTHPRYRVAIARARLTEPGPSLTFSYFDFPQAAIRLACTSSLWQIYYHAWQRKIGSWSREVCNEFQPDVVHHITYGRYWCPCSLWRLNRPLVWGPIGGGDDCPPAFLAQFSVAERLSEWVRSLARRIASWDPETRATARAAAVAVASTQATQEKLLALGCRRVVSMAQNALDPAWDGGREYQAATEPVFCSIARLLPWKGQAWALDAFARAKIPGSRLVMVGSGSCQRRLVRRAERLGIAAQVNFTGNLPWSDAKQVLEGSVALLNPSVHDQSPTIVLQAMALGVPVIALDLAGPALQLTAECGFLIEAGTPEQAISDIAIAMRRLVREPGLRRRLGEAGMMRVRERFTWEKQALKMEPIYREATGLTEKDVAIEPDLIRRVG